MNATNVIVHFPIGRTCARGDLDVPGLHDPRQANSPLGKVIPLRQGQNAQHVDRMLKLRVLHASIRALELSGKLHYSRFDPEEDPWKLPLSP
jgi:hypothetical protein